MAVQITDSQVAEIKDVLNTMCKGIRNGPVDCEACWLFDFGLQDEDGNVMCRKNQIIKELEQKQ